jgi:predicted nucleic acid-binding protein
VRLLPDTSVWVQYLRHGSKGSAGTLDEFLRAGNAVVCGPVVAELLAGTKQADRSELWQLLSSLPWADIGRDEWRQVGEVAARLRAAGTPVALTDVEIAVAAVGSAAALWSYDEDFERIASALPELQPYRPA